MFIQGLKLYDRQWKSIADLIQTRTVVQVRTHAQKYFIKLMKHRNDDQPESYSDDASLIKMVNKYKKNIKIIILIFLENY